MELTSLFFIAIILLIAAIVKSFSGFGFGILSIPFLLFFLPPSAAIPLILGLNLPIEFLLLMSMKPNIDTKHISPLIAGGVLGVPIGVWLITSSDQSTLNTIISATILLIAILMITNVLPRLSSSLPARSVMGFIAGMLHGFSSLAGTFIAAYLDGTGEKKALFRADMVVFTTILNIIAVLLFILLGFATIDLAMIALIMLPIVLLGTFIGNGLAKHVSQKQFHMLIMSIVIVASAASTLYHGSSFLG